MAPGWGLDCAGCKKQTGDVAPEASMCLYMVGNMQIMGGSLVRPSVRSFVRTLGPRYGLQLRETRKHA